MASILSWPQCVKAYLQTFGPIRYPDGQMLAVFITILCNHPIRIYCLMYGHIHNFNLNKTTSLQFIQGIKRVAACHLVQNRACHPGGHYWDHYLGTLSISWSPLGQNGRHIGRRQISNAFSWMKMIEFQFEFHLNLFPGVQLTISQHWFRSWLGIKQATIH